MYVCKSFYRFCTVFFFLFFSSYSSGFNSLPLYKKEKEINYLLISIKSAVVFIYLFLAVC